MTTIRIATTILTIVLVGVLLDFTTVDISKAYAAGSLGTSESDIAQQQDCAPQQPNCETYSEEQGEETSDILQHQDEEDNEEDNSNPGEK